MIALADPLVALIPIVSIWGTFGMLYCMMLIDTWVRRRFQIGPPTPPPIQDLREAYPLF